MIPSQESFGIVFTRPISAVYLRLAIFLLLLALLPRLGRRREEPAAQGVR